tara:strand:+ start:26 stop:700 length:675 start_codon:yes stop_codon:yes gene_type:complete
VCEPVTLASAALSGASQVMAHQAEGQAVAGRNRAKLRNFEEQNRLYDREVMLDRAQYRNDMQLEDVKQDDIYRAMVDQWTQEDVKLNRLFADADMKLEESVREMYQNEYAGTQTGATAARLAGKSAKELGQKKSQALHSLMMSEEEATISKDIAKEGASAKSRDAYEAVRFAPIHGPTPMAPELEAKPSSASLLLGLGQTGLQGYKDFKASGAPNIFSKKKGKG